MLKIKKILAPTDLKEKSLAGLKYAISLAREHGAEVIVLYVVNEGLMPGTAMVPFEEEVLVQREWIPIGGGSRRLIKDEIQKRDLYLYRFLRHRIEPEALKVVKVKRIIRLGDVVEEIVSVAGERECDLIVMASRGRGWLARMISGSMSEKVARKAPCPVLTIQPSAVVREDGRRVPVRSHALGEVRSSLARRREEKGREHVCH